MPDKKVIDIHVHIGGPGDLGSGCRMSNQFMESSLGEHPNHVHRQGT